MSEKRYSVTEYSKENVPEVLCDGNTMDESDIADLLNEQAETIEVLREWIRENKIMVKMETRLAESETTVDKFKELANRRIAALEGK